MINMPMGTIPENTKLLTDMLWIASQDLDSPHSPLMSLAQTLLSMEHENQKSTNKQWQTKYQALPLSLVSSTLQLVIPTEEKAAPSPRVPPTSVISDTSNTTEKMRGGNNEASSFPINEIPLVTVDDPKFDTRKLLSERGSKISNQRIEPGRDGNNDVNGTLETTETTETTTETTIETYTNSEFSGSIAGLADCSFAHATSVSKKSRKAEPTKKKNKPVLDRRKVDDRSRKVKQAGGAGRGRTDPTREDKRSQNRLLDKKKERNGQMDDLRALAFGLGPQDENTSESSKDDLAFAFANDSDDGSASSYAWPDEDQIALLREQLNSINLNMEEEDGGGDAAFDFLKNFNLRETPPGSLKRQGNHDDPNLSQGDDDDEDDDNDDDDYHDVDGNEDECYSDQLSDEEVSDYEVSDEVSDGSSSGGDVDDGFGPTTLEAALLGLRGLGS
eukprot:TRINITY_DN6052_c0_g1_i9.p1 TRINITY_DN6052_c0_g1~~TRINITY_DN6052_c0_g1_i9.p1  ORF type:complete len:445 (+),score=113.72 TRINITY_DN6052_c0_g1_i9:558-1892(+)